MTDGTLVWGSQAWVAAAAAAAAVSLALLAWAYRGAPASGWVRGIAFGLKATALAALAVCLAEPLLSGTRPRPGANLFLIVADESRSLQIRGQKPGTCPAD